MVTPADIVTDVVGGYMTYREALRKLRELDLDEKERSKYIGIVRTLCQEEIDEGLLNGPFFSIPDDLHDPILKRCIDDIRGGVSGPDIVGYLVNDYAMGEDLCGYFYNEAMTAVKLSQLTQDEVQMIGEAWVEFKNGEGE